MTLSCCYDSKAPAFKMGVYLSHETSVLIWALQSNVRPTFVRPALPQSMHQRARKHPSTADSSDFTAHATSHCQQLVASTLLVPKHPSN